MESTCVSSFYQDYRRKFIRAPRVPWLFFKYGFLKCTIQISFFENLFKIWKLRKNFKAQFSWRLHNVRLFVKLPKFFVSADPSTVHPLLLEYNESHSKTSFKRQPASLLSILEHTFKMVRWTRFFLTKFLLNSLWLSKSFENSN